MPFRVFQQFFIVIGLKSMIIQMQFKSKKSKKYCKYNKITQQKKFHLLTLVLKEKFLIKQAAKIVGINYSTAKTIIFFHRNHGKSYQFDFQTNVLTQNCPKRLVASFMEIPFSCSGHPDSSQDRTFSPELIDIISTIGSKQTKIDLNSLQTRFMDGHLDHSNSPSQKSNQLGNYMPDELNELRQLRNCQCERRITRAQSAKQAAQDPFCPPEHNQELSYQNAGSFQQHKNQ